MLTTKRRGLDQLVTFTDTGELVAYLLTPTRFLQPHWWFRTQFTPEFGVAIADFVNLGVGHTSRQSLTNSRSGLASLVR